jgi:hypothetical protein
VFSFVLVSAPNAAASFASSFFAIGFSAALSSPHTSIHSSLFLPNDLAIVYLTNATDLTGVTLL